MAAPKNRFSRIHSFCQFARKCKATSETRIFWHLLFKPSLAQTEPSSPSIRVFRMQRFARPATTKRCVRTSAVNKARGGFFQPVSPPKRASSTVPPIQEMRPYTKADFMKRALLDINIIRKQREEGQDNVVDQVSPWLLPICLISYSTWILAWASELGGSTAPDWVAPTLGALLGAAFSAAHRAGTVRFWQAPTKPLNIVITGATRGIGRAIAREFVQNGDNVYIASRSAKAVRETVAELQALPSTSRPSQVAGMDCDVTKASSVKLFVSAVKTHFRNDSIDVWINNAGCSGSFKSFLEADPAHMQQVVNTNLLGALLCTRAALQVMGSQETGGHIFNMDGAGADCTGTPNYAVYGATKAGIAHLMSSIAAEVDESGMDVGVHTLSPGMVLTELLLDGATLKNKQVFNVLCEQPEVVAAFLVPRIRTVCARNENMAYIKYLTSRSAIARLLTAPMRLGRFFASDGTATYPSEEERLSGSHSKRTARLLSKARARGNELQVAYASSLTASVLLLCMTNSL